jgi:hypothetical protein
MPRHHAGPAQEKEEEKEGLAKAGSRPGGRPNAAGGIAFAGCAGLLSMFPTAAGNDLIPFRHQGHRGSRAGTVLQSRYAVRYGMQYVFRAG